MLNSESQAYVLTSKTLKIIQSDLSWISDVSTLLSLKNDLNWKRHFWKRAEKGSTFFRAVSAKHLHPSYATDTGYYKFIFLLQTENIFVPWMANVQNAIFWLHLLRHWSSINKGNYRIKILPKRVSRAKSR